MEFVNVLFIDAVVDLILLRFAKEELHETMDPDEPVPAWITGSTRTLYERAPNLTCYVFTECAPHPLAAVDGNWGEMFAISCNHYRFISMALYLPTELSQVVCAFREYEIFCDDNTHCYTGHDLFDDGHLNTDHKNILLNLYCFEGTVNLYSWWLYNSDITEPPTKNKLFSTIDQLNFSANPKISFRNLSSTVHTPQIVDRIRRCQCDTEVVNSPDLLALLRPKGQETPQRFGKTLSVGVTSLGEIYEALELACFSEFRFHKLTKECFTANGFMERVKTSICKRSTKESISIIVEDDSLALELLGSATEGVAFVDSDLSISVELPKQQTKSVSLFD